MNQLYTIWIIRSTTNCWDSFKTRLFMLLKCFFLLSYGSNGEHQLAWFSMIIIRFQADMLLNHLKENHFVDTRVTSLDNRLLSGLYSNRTHDGRSATPNHFLLFHWNFIIFDVMHTIYLWYWFYFSYDCVSNWNCIFFLTLTKSKL